MLVRAHDAPNDEDEWRHFVGAAEFGELVAPGSAQLRCTATVIDDAAALAEILRRLMDRFEPEGGSQAIEPGDNPFGKLLSAIRGLRLHVEEVHAKFKFGGNKGADHRLQIADHLGARGGPQDAEARQHLLRRSGLLD